jgi:NADH-quinone oxidoreductase subunit G
MSNTKMVNLTVEGRAVAVPEGTSILEAAKHAGVLIPHYCYHPGLPVAGVCRMCLVEVEKAPKLAPACATNVAEGQVVHVRTEKALESRKGVLEFLLINHPLDCPICDQSGECELQDYVFQEGRKESRYVEPKRFNPVEDFGGDTVYVPNRCILCTRCVRFMEDVAQDPVLNVSERGDRAYIGKFEGRDLTHPWSGNVVDLCPVGALLSKDSLNKARAWELDRSASICTGCSQGCNITIESRDNMVIRIKPRPNTDVNQYFICDHGRLNYRWINRQDRLQQPMVQRGGALAPVEWEQAMESAAALLRGRKVHVIASPRLSNEALFLLGRIVAHAGGRGLFRAETGEEAPLAGVADLALRAERAPNCRGAELHGFTRVADVTQGLSPGDVVLVADDDLAGVERGAFAAAAALINISTTSPEAAKECDVSLPISNNTEEEGTFTNLRGRVQRFLQARAAPGQARPSWFVLADLVGALGEPGDYLLPSQVFDAMALSAPAFSGMSYDSLALRGMPLSDAAVGSAPR